MSAPRARRRLVAALMTAAVLTVAGCTDDTPSDPPGSGTGSEQEEQPETQTPDGPTPQELSRQVLAVADEAADAPVIGTATGTLKGAESLTVEVLAVQRQDDATFVTMRWTAPVPFNPGFADFYDRRREDDNLNFARSLFLEDPAVSGQRLLPLQFTDYRDACACPYFPMEIGPDPQVVTAVYPALPDATTTVDLRFNDTGFAVSGLPVS